MIYKLMTRIGICGRRKDEPMHYPRTFVISLEADSNIIPSAAYANDIASNRVHEVISGIPCTSNNREIMLNSGVTCQLISLLAESMDNPYPVKM